MDLSHRGRGCGYAAEKQEEEWGARVGAGAGTSPGKRRVAWVCWEGRLRL